MNLVTEFERAFAEYVGAEHAIAMCNGTATLHAALDALWFEYLHELRVAVPPLTMASTTIAVLHAGGAPVFVDVEPDTWLADIDAWRLNQYSYGVPVSLYGLRYPPVPTAFCIDDAAQTLRPHDGRMGTAFTSYSFQASKILPLGEGGMLVTNDADLARRAREFASLGYPMPDGVIDRRAIRDPGYARHHSLGWNYRMNEVTAKLGLMFLRIADRLKQQRRDAAELYRQAMSGTDWITPQHVPDGWEHDYWAFAVALEHAELWHPFVDSIERHGGERPYAAWRLTYQEPAFRHLAEDGTCPVAEDLQPRLVQFQTNDPLAAKRNADAVAAAILEVGGVPA